MKHFFNELRLLGVLLICLPAALLAQDFPVNTDSAGARAHFVTGLRALDANRQDDARNHFDQALEKDSNFAAALVYRAFAATSGADWKAHMMRAQDASSSATPWVQKQIERQLAFVDNDTAKAYALGQALVAQYPTTARAYVLLANDYTGQEMYAEARGALRTAMALNADFAPAYSALSNSYIFNDPKDLKMAEHYARKLTAISPEEPYSHIMVGDAARAQNEFERARDAYAAGIDINPADTVAHSKKGHAESFLGNYESARKDYAAAADAAQTLAARMTQHNFVAYTYLHANQVEEAMKANGKIIEQIQASVLPAEETTFPMWNAYWERGRIAMNNGMFEEAEEAFAKQAELTEKAIIQVNIPAWAQTQRAADVLSSAMLAAHRGELDEARAMAAQHHDMLDGQSNVRRHEGYHQLMGIVESKAGNYAAAIEHFAKANDQDPMVKFQMAEAYEASGNADKARQLFGEVAQFNFNGLSSALVRSKAIARLKT